MKVLFLDVDGVLNSHDWFRLRGNRQTGIDESRWWIERLVFDLDPRAVARLNIILERTGAVCVLSSTWRIVRGLDPTREALVKRGFAGQLVGATPDLAGAASAGGIYIGATRGAEIQAWLDANPCERFAIVDDDSDMGPLLPKLVTTSTDYGLTDAEMVRLIHRLT